MSFVFTDDNLSKIAKLKKRYPDPRALNLPCLWMAQYQEGYISLDAMQSVAKITGLPPMEVYRVASFYTMFKLEKQKKLRVTVCKTLSCKLCGSDELLKHLEDKGVEVEHAECLGSCGTAPALEIDDVLYEDMTPKKLDKILEELS